MKKSTGGLQYVSEFSFPSDQGFTGSAGKTSVKGYQRGGAVKKAKGGPVKKAMGGFTGPEREIAVDDVTVTVPRAKGGYMKGGSTHDKLVKHGAKMGYAYGGRVKDTSGEFVAKKGPMKSMDHGVQPARRGKNARNQAEAEAGGTGRLKPGLKKGGRVKIKGRASSGGGALADAALKGAKVAHRARPRKPMKKPESARKASKEGMPKNVKMAGGMVRKARGGSVKK